MSLPAPPSPRPTPLFCGTSSGRRLSASRPKPSEIRPVNLRQFRFSDRCTDSTTPELNCYYCSFPSSSSSISAITAAPRAGAEPSAETSIIPEAGSLSNFGVAAAVCSDIFCRACLSSGERRPFIDADRLRAAVIFAAAADAAAATTGSGSANLVLAGADHFKDFLFDRPSPTTCCNDSAAVPSSVVADVFKATSVASPTTSPSTTRRDGGDGERPTADAASSAAWWSSRCAASRAADGCSTAFDFYSRLHGSLFSGVGLPLFVNRFRPY